MTGLCPHCGETGCIHCQAPITDLDVLAARRASFTGETVVGARARILEVSKIPEHHRQTEALDAPPTLRALPGGAA